MQTVEVQALAKVAREEAAQGTAVAPMAEEEPDMAAAVPMVVVTEARVGMAAWLAV